MRIIYADTLFFINFAVNYMVLLATAKISATYVKRLKIVLGALLGSAYALAAVLVAQTLMQSLGFKLGAAMLMLLICFGKKPGLLRITLIFFSISASFGGIVLAISLIGGGSVNDALVPVSLKILIPSFALTYAVITLVFKKLGRARPGGFVHIVIKNDDRKIEMNSLIDTGNSLTDPLSGNAVIVAETEAVAPLFDKKVADMLRKGPNAAETLESLGGSGQLFRLISYSSVGVSRGMLLAFKPDTIIINGKDKTGMLVAISPTRLSEGGIYSAIIGSQALEVRV